MNRLANTVQAADIKVIHWPQQGKVIVSVRPDGADAYTTLTLEPVQASTALAMGVAVLKGQTQWGAMRSLISANPTDRQYLHLFPSYAPGYCWLFIGAKAAAVRHLYLSTTLLRETVRGLRVALRTLAAASAHTP